MRDTGDFLCRLNECDKSEVTWLCTLDVKSLYTNIPYQEGFDAVVEKLKLDPSISNRELSFLLAILEFILTKNYFRFGDDCYLQLQGTSMANVESGILKGPFSKSIVTWMRFVDDIFVLWAGTLNESEEFEKGINMLHPLLQFSMTKSEHEICFLDVQVIKKNQQFHTTLFTKPTDRNSLLRRDSHHAPQTFNGIAKGQFMRARKICSSDAEYQKNKITLTNKFVAKGYDKEKIRKAGEEVANMERTELLKNKKKDNTFGEEISFISTYDIHSELIKKSIKKAWPLLQCDSKYNKLFKNPPKFIYRKGKTIANQLVKSDISQKKIPLLLSTQQKGTFPCGGCQNCSSIIKGPNIYHPARGYAIPARGFFTCNSIGVIYLGVSIGVKMPLWLGLHRANIQGH